MDELFQKAKSLNADIKRNIVSLKKSEDLFDDLHDGQPGFTEVAQAAEAQVKRDCLPDIISRGFHYTTSIVYPFENYQWTRYSDGSFGCWYGSLDLDTTIYETAYHNLKNELGIVGINEIIHRERAVYNIYCEGVLIDISDQAHNFPALIAEDYVFTQQIGKKLSTEGHPGLLVPSARIERGVNVVAFNPKILKNPRVASYLTYQINAMNKTVRVEKDGKKYLDINFSQSL